MAFLARALRRTAERGDAVGRIRIPRIGASYVVVDGTDTASLRKGPGIYDDTPFPGAPGTVAIAGHRTTYLAPFRHIDELRARRRDLGRDALRALHLRGRAHADRRARREVSVIKRVGYDRLVLSACHPLYSADKRIVVFARLVDARAARRGAAP